MVNKLLMNYDGCHQATDFRLLVDGQPALKLVRIRDGHCNDAITLRINWLCKQNAITPGNGTFQIDVTPEVTQVVNEIQYLLGYR